MAAAFQLLRSMAQKQLTAIPFESAYQLVAERLH